MAIAEFDPRRDFLLAFARRSRGGGQPPRRPVSRPSSTSPQPPDWGEMVSRREVIIAAGTAVAAAILKPWEWFASNSEQFVVPELKRLGEEVTNWQIYGIKISDVFPEAKKAAGVLTGKIDPRSFFPTMKLPVLFDPNAPDAAFNLNLVEDDDSKSLLVTLPSGQTFPLPWISN